MTDRPRVALVRCWDYTPQKVHAATAHAIDLLGQTTAFIPVGARLLLKPNCLDASKPHKGVTTHPAVFRAVAELLAHRGYQLSYGDSPAVDTPVKALKVAGFYQVGNELHLELGDFLTSVERAHPTGKLIKKFTLVKALADADRCVSLPKLKTHGQMYFTGAVKNMFGLIPGLRKAEYHFKLPDTKQFAQMLVDLYALVRPVLSVMDGIVSMDGNGPKSGRLRDSGVILASTDGVALDAVACALVGIDAFDVPVLRRAHEQGVGVADVRDIEVVGEPIAQMKVKYFEVFKPAPDVRFLGPFLSAQFKALVTFRPVIDPRRCNACYTCVTICPSQPKSMRQPVGARRTAPWVNYKTCIRCYCCQEVCPTGAIRLWRNPLVTLVLYFLRLLNKPLGPTRQ